MARRHVPSSSTPNAAGIKELATQLLLLQKHADDMFQGLASYTTSLEARVTNLSARIATAASSNPRTTTGRYSQRLGGSLDKSICLSTAVRVFPPERPSWLQELYQSECMERVPPLHVMDAFVADPALLESMGGSCAKCYSNADFFLERWQSQQEARMEAMQKEKTARRAERRERKRRADDNTVSKKNQMPPRASTSTSESAANTDTNVSILSDANTGMDAHQQPPPPPPPPPPQPQSQVATTSAPNMSQQAEPSTPTPSHQDPQVSNVGAMLAAKLPAMSAMSPLPPKPKPAVMTSRDLTPDRSSSRGSRGFGGMGGGFAFNARITSQTAASLAAEQKQQQRPKSGVYGLSRLSGVFGKSSEARLSMALSLSKRRLDDIGDGSVDGEGEADDQAHSDDDEDDDSKTAAAPTAGGMKVKDHPDYEPFFKMLKVGLPIFVVQAKATGAGLDPTLLERPDDLMPTTGKPSQPAPTPVRAPAPAASSTGAADEGAPPFPPPPPPPRPQTCTHPEAVTSSRLSTSRLRPASVDLRKRHSINKHPPLRGHTPPRPRPDPHQPSPLPTSPMGGLLDSGANSAISSILARRKYLENSQEDSDSDEDGAWA